MQIPIVAANLTKFISFGPCRVRSIHGFNNQGADVFIQLFDALPVSSSVNVSNTTVPVCKSLHTQQANSFKWEFDDGLDFVTGLVVGMSSTETPFTSVAAAGGVDATIVVDGPYLVANYGGLTVVGSTIAAVSSLLVWADGTTAANRLLRLVVNSNSGADRYAVGYAVDTPTVNDKQQFINKVPDTVNVSFSGNLIPFSKRAADQSLHNGLTLVLADTTAIANQSASTAAFMAIYNTVQ